MVHIVKNYTGDVLNMTRGFEAVVQALGADKGSPPGRLLIIAGRTLVSTVGGASGPLWGSALRAGGRTLGDETTFDGAQLAEVLGAALASVKDLGTAALGDKTMVDALEPAVETLRARIADGEPLPHALEAAASAAEAGMRGTIPLQARKGRASYLGERSVGQSDPRLLACAGDRRPARRAARSTDQADARRGGAARRVCLDSRSGNRDRTRRGGSRRVERGRADL